uniref:Putative ovule protein n=1 Tax=Solanum chacoense TaxID=4108 RepID=A0A0V0GHN7_SOLCH
MSCISTVTTQILINGECSPGFSPTRGISQGDPLSPYLFILCMEMLSRHINLAVDYHTWEPFKIKYFAPLLCG